MTSLPQKPPIAVPDAAEEETQHGTTQTPPIANVADTISESRPVEAADSADPPLPSEEPPPLPEGESPTEQKDDGWAAVWDDGAQAFYFYNRFTHATQWENPRIPETGSGIADSGPLGAAERTASKRPVAGGYDPAIHGDYDPEADYAKASSAQPEDASTSIALNDPARTYEATGAFNRFTGKWQSAEINADKFNDENKSRRQMNAFFDVDAAANSHDGRSLKAERSNKKISKAELKAFKEKRKERKEEKRRAWLRD